MPGTSTPLTATPRIIFKQIDIHTNLAQGKIIDGANSRDAGNVGATNVLRPGLLMGKATSGGKYRPSLLGINQTAYTSGGTAVTVTAAQAAEISRRVGASGNLSYVGPPSANGTVGVLSTIAYSAINTTTGVITTSSLGANLVAGGFVVAADGTGYPTCFISDDMPTGVLVTANDMLTGIDVPMPYLPVAGIVISSQLLPSWPTDTSLQKWIFDSLNGRIAGVTTGEGKFVRDDVY